MNRARALFGWPFAAMLLGANACAPGAAPVGTGGVDAAANGPDGGPDAQPGTPDARPAGPVIVYTGGSDNLIHWFSLDPTNLAFTPLGSIGTGAGPSFLAFDPHGRWLVAVNEGGNAVESFAITAGTGALTRVNATSTKGSGPAHVGVDRTGAWVLVANYGDGTAAVIPIAADGTLGAAVATVSPGANTHEFVVDAANTTAYLPCLGADHVAIFGFDAATGGLTPRPSAPAATGAGPRHLALSPSGKVAWVINETASTITTYAIGAAGALTAMGTVSTLPAGFTGANTGAEIAVDATGRFVYASNRGDDSIATFAVAVDGTLAPIANTKTGGVRPRHFSLALGGSVLLVANQDSGTITEFFVDGATGSLTSLGVVANVPGPEFVSASAAPK